MSTAAVDPIRDREARATAELDGKCVRAWRKAGNFVKAARAMGVSTARVQAAVERLGPEGRRGPEPEPAPTLWAPPTPAPSEEVAKAKAPRLEPRFPVQAFTPESKCNHATHPFPKGSPEYCPVCHRCGLDGLHPELYRNPKLDPPREPKAKAQAAEKPGKPMTRAQRRKALAEALADHERDAKRSEYEARKARAARVEAARREANGRPTSRSR